MSFAATAHRPAFAFRAVMLALLVHLFVVALLTVNFHWRRSVAPVTIIKARVVTEVPRPRARPVKPGTVAVPKGKTVKVRRQNARKWAARRRAAALKERQKQAEKMLQQQLVAEEAERARAARLAKADKQIAQFMDQIGRRISAYWKRPPGSAKDAFCVLRVRVVPGGEVISVTVVRSSGDAFFDRAVENAINLATPLPVPKDPEIFELLREFNIDSGQL